ncbi:MAG TPA: ROK family protein [Solirubrobacteraceae bacterium]|nr:ROK family protein [Solirubrobacteraceae bacterium]
MTEPVIGIDLRPTEVAAAPLVGAELGDSLVRPTKRSDPDALVDQLAEMVESAGPDGRAAVGIGVPRIVEFGTGRVFSTSRAAAPATNGAVDLPLADVPLRQVLAERLGVPVFVDNDANAAALAEAHDADLELVTRNLVMLRVGTNVGGGLVLGGRIYRGATGAAGELGHTIVGLDLAGSVPKPMGFPQPGSLEFVAAGHALDRLAGVARSVHPGSALARLRAAGKPVLGADVVEAALAGDESAARMVEIWGQRIGIGVANAIHSFDPEEVVIGGDAARASALLLEPARRVALEYVLPGLGAHTTIRLARHGADAGVLAAALLARSELTA